MFSFPVIPSKRSIMAETELKRTVSLAGAIAITVGSVIGMSIFVLINSMASLTGPSLPLAFLFALVVASLNAITVSQLSSSIPRSGGGYVLTSRILGPFWGVITSWFICLAIIGALCTVGLGIAKYINLYITPPANEILITTILVALLVIINALGLLFAEMVQIIIVVLKVVALLMFAVWGFFWAPRADLTAVPFLAGGIGGLALCSVLCYYSYIGFTVIAEVGEEMSNAKRNIPLSVAISAVIIFVVYFSVAITFNRIMGYNPQMLKGLSAPLAYAGGLFLPKWALHFLNLGALGAGITAINAGVMAMPREIFAQGRDRMVPSVFKYLTKKSRTPLWSVLVVFPLFLALLLFNRSVDWYGFLAVGALLVTNITIAVACLRLPKRFPDRYEKAPFKIGRRWLTFFSWAAIVTSVIFLGFIVLQFGVLPLLLVGWGIVVIVYYVARKWWIERNGIDFEGIFKKIPGYEERQ
jgi:basic amino acid/polyamine antiporter, APA family